MYLPTYLVNQNGCGRKSRAPSAEMPRKLLIHWHSIHPESQSDSAETMNQNGCGRKSRAPSAEMPRKLLIHWHSIHPESLSDSAETMNQNGCGRKSRARMKHGFFSNARSATPATQKNKGNWMSPSARLPRETKVIN